MSKQDRAKMFADMGCTSRSGDYKFNELVGQNNKANGKDAQQELGKRYYANLSTGGKVSKGKNAISEFANI